MLKKLAIALISLVLLPTAAQAQDPSSDSVAPSEALQQRSEDVVAILRGDKQPQGIFSEAFLAAIPATQLEAINTQLTTQFGPVVGVETLEPTGAFNANIAIRFEKAIGSGTIAVSPNGPHMIEGLLLQQFDPIDDSIEKIKADLEALPGTVNAYFGLLDGESPVLSMNADDQLAMGSTFKLYVLAALADSIAREERAWEDVTELDARSFPSGLMQDWPDSAPMTLHTAATLMISISDNTATDLLISRVGRDDIERYQSEAGHSSPERNTPFLYTHELFIIKGEGTAEDYLALSEEEKRSWLIEISGSSVGLDRINQAFAGGPVAIDTVEWFASANDLRRLFAHMVFEDYQTAFEIMAINPSMPDAIRERWSYVGYKGGSEPGVLNLTWLLRDTDNQWHVLTLGWNNTEAALDNSALELIAQRILALPR